MSKMPEKVVKYSYPSRFGSHKSMLVDESEIFSSLPYVTLQDEFGQYITEHYRLDNGLADPNRTSTARISKLFEGRKKEEK